MQRRGGRKAVFIGAIIITIGVLWLLRKMGAFIPDWVISWQMFLIVIGVGTGISNGFQKVGSWIMIVIGLVFLVNDIFFIPVEIREYFWPVMLIIIGMVVILKPKRHKYGGHGHDNLGDPSADAGEPTAKGTFGRHDKLDSVSVFTGVKRQILSKNFLGGETVTVFGGTELNLLQADFDKMVNLEVTVIFGGLKLIVPQNWEVRSEVTSILAGVEDKRFSAVQVIPEDKVLVLTGTVIFGGVDIVSY